jgi:DNA anti-recombination protein RmuC
MAANASDAPLLDHDDAAERAAEAARVRQEAARLRHEAKELRATAAALHAQAEADRDRAARLVRDAEAAASARLVEAGDEARRLRATTERRVQELVSEGEAAVRAMIADAGANARRRLDDAAAEEADHRRRDAARVAGAMAATPGLTPLEPADTAAHHDSRTQARRPRGIGNLLPGFSSS